MRRTLILLLALAAIALTAAGCGDSGSSGDAFDDSLGYMPKNTLAVVAIKTDPEDEQFKNIEKIVDKFPFANQFKDRLKQGIEAGGTRASYEKDIKPLLGNDFVVGVPPEPAGSTGGDALPGDDNAYVLAWKTAGGDIEKLISKSSKKAGESEGATIYQDPDGSVNAIKDDVVIAAKTRPLLDAALKAHEGDDPYTEDDFNAGMEDLSQDAIIRVSGNVQTILANDPDSAEAKKVPWVNGLRNFGATLSTAPDGVSVDFQLKTEGVTAEQSPLATGAASAPLVQRPGEVGVGIRNPAQLVNFAIDTAGKTDPDSMADKEKFEKALGVDLEQDVLAQMSGNASVSVSLDDKFAARADLKDAAAFEETLATIMKTLPKAERATGDTPSQVQDAGDGLYTVTDEDGPTVIGIVSEKLVVASDADRAKEIAAQSTAPVPNEKGAVVMSADPSAIVNKALEEQGNSGAAALIGPALSSHLDVLSGSVEGQPDGLRGHLRLGVK